MQDADPCSLREFAAGVATKRFKLVLERETGPAVLELLDSLRNDSTVALLLSALRRNPALLVSSVIHVVARRRNYFFFAVQGSPVSHS